MSLSCEGPNMARVWQSSKKKKKEPSERTLHLAISSQKINGREDPEFPCPSTETSIPGF